MSNGLKRSITELDPDVDRMLKRNTGEGRVKKHLASELIIRGMLHKGLSVPKKLIREYLHKAA